MAASENEREFTAYTRDALALLDDVTASEAGSALYTRLTFVDHSFIEQKSPLAGSDVLAKVDYYLDHGCNPKLGKVFGNERGKITSREGFVGISESDIFGRPFFTTEQDGRVHSCFAPETWAALEIAGKRPLAVGYETNSQTAPVNGSKEMTNRWLKMLIPGLQANYLFYEGLFVYDSSRQNTLRFEPESFRNSPAVRATLRIGNGVSASHLIEVFEAARSHYSATNLNGHS